MKRQLFFLLFTSMVFIAMADEFVVRSFAPAPADLAAIQSGCTDVNDEKCAIIKVRTDIRNLTFDSGKKLAQDVEFRNGEFWLYVSPGERRISLIKEDFITLHYQIPVPVEPSKVYILEVTNKDKSGGGTGTMEIITDPPQAKVIVSELSGLEFITPVLFENYPSFAYSINISKDRYAAIDTVLSIHPNEEITHVLTMKPLWGDIKIEVWPGDASIYVNDTFRSVGGRTFSGLNHGIDIGRQIISVKKEGFYTNNKEVEIATGDNETLRFDLLPVKGFLQIDAIPSDASLFINGKNEKLPYADSVQIGSYEIRLEREEYMAVLKTIEILEKQTTTVSEELPHTTYVRVTSSPSQAEIFCNGKASGRTPANVLVTYGYNDLLLKKENYDDFNISINVDAETEKFNFTLQPKKYKLEITSQPPEATIYVDRQPAGASPAALELRHGQYRLMAEKRGYFRKRKLLRVDDDKASHHFQLKSLSHIRFGVMYGENSYGGEFTWSKNLTAFTIGYYQPQKLTFNKTIHHESINASNFIGLYNHQKVGKVTNTDSLNFQIVAKVHAHLNKIPTFSLTFGIALGSVAFSEVYRAEEDIESWWFENDIDQGEYFSIARESNFLASPIIGVSFRFFRYFYVGAEYWFNTQQGNNPWFNGGLCFPLN
jgi:hypothetical protein